METTSKTYWLTDKAEKVTSRLGQWHQNAPFWSNHPVCQAWVRNSMAYYSPILDAQSWDTALTYTGEQGELVKMSVPQARSLIRQVVTLTTKERLAFDVIAQTPARTTEVNPVEVMKTCRLGDSLIAQILKDQQVDLKGENLCEMSLVLGLSFIQTIWRSDKGLPYAVGENGEMLYDGDIEIQVRHPDEVLFDYTIPDFDSLDWAEVRTIKNRWNLIAQFPHLRDDLINLEPIKIGQRSNAYEYFSVGETDLVFIYEMYAKPTPSLPAGRMIIYGDPNTIIYDGPNPYEKIPLEIMKPEPIIGSGFGFPMFSYLLPAQEMMDACLSAAATNFGNMGVNNIITPKGSNVGIEDFAGMNLLTYTPQNASNGGKPEVLDLSKTNPQILEFPNALLNHMQQMVNLNSAARGAPPPGVTAGVAIATLTANALEFLSSVSKSYELALERTMTNAIKFYDKFAKIPKAVTLSTRNRQTTEGEFKAGDLKTIKQIKIVRSSPVMATSAGRTDMADKLLQTGLIKTPQDYISVIEGAPLSTLTDDTLDENELVELENEAMEEGTQVQALATDNHAYHIWKHKAKLNDPRVRMNGSMVKLHLDHIQEHMNLLRQTDPMLLAIVNTGQAPAPQMMAPPPQSQSPQTPKGPPPVDDFGPPRPQGAKPSQPAEVKR